MNRRNLTRVIIVCLALLIAVGPAIAQSPQPLTMFQEAVLVPQNQDGSPDTGLTEDFGKQVLMHGDVLVVADRYHNNNGASGQESAVYIYERAGGVWTFVQRFITPDGTQIFNLLDFDGERLLLSTHLNSTFPPQTYRNGSVYVYVRQGQQWVLESQLMPPDTQYGMFGTVGGVEGDWAAVARTGGPIYVYHRTGSTWSYVQTLPNTAYQDLYSIKDIEMDGGRIAFSRGTGLVLIYGQVGGVWVEVGRTDNVGLGPMGYNYGYALSLDGDTLAVGAPYLQDYGALWQDGSWVFVYELAGGMWVQQAAIENPYAYNSKFGAFVAIDDGLLSTSTGGYYGGVQAAERFGEAWITHNGPITGAKGGFDVYGGRVAVAGTMSDSSRQIRIFRPIGFVGAPQALTIPEGDSAEHALTISHPPLGSVALVAQPGALCDLGAGPGQAIYLGFTAETLTQTVSITVPDDEIYRESPACIVQYAIVPDLTEDPGFLAFAPFQLPVQIVEDEIRPTNTPTLTLTPSNTKTATNIRTPTPIITPSATPTPTLTPSQTDTATPTETLSYDPTQVTFTPVSTDVPTDGPTDIPTDGPTSTPSFTYTSTPWEQTRTATHTPTPLPSETLEPTPSPTSTPTPTDTETQTSVPTETLTPTETQTPSDTPDPCAFLTSTPTRTPIGFTPTLGGGGEHIAPRDNPCAATYTPTAMPTLTSTATNTPTHTPTFTATAIPSNTPQPTPTPNARVPLQLLANPGFEMDGKRLPGWKVLHVPLDRPDDKPVWDGALSVFRFKGGPDESTRLKQVVPASASDFWRGDAVSLSLNYRQIGSAPDIRVKLRVIYDDLTPDSILLLPINEAAGQYRSLTSGILLSSGAVREFRLSLTNRAVSRKTKVLIDSAELWWLPAP